MFRNEVDRLFLLGVLKEANVSEWGSPSLSYPKLKTDCIRFLSNFRNPERQLKHKPYNMPKICEMLLNLEGFQCATSLDLNLGYYHILLNEEARNLCTIILPRGKYKYRHLPMGVCNSPDTFQEKTNEMFCRIEFIRACIDDLLVITKGDWSGHLDKLELVLKDLRANRLK